MALMAIVCVGHREIDRSVTVTFPDFEGAGTSGDTLEEALARAKDNIEFHIEGRIEDGLGIPKTRSVEELMTDAEFSRSLLPEDSLYLIWAESPGRAIRVNVTLDEGLLARVDKAAAFNGESRSGFLANAARDRLKARV